MRSSKFQEDQEELDADELSKMEDDEQERREEEVEGIYDVLEKQDTKVLNYSVISKTSKQPAQS